MDCDLLTVVLCCTRILHWYVLGEADARYSQVSKKVLGKMHSNSSSNEVPNPNVSLQINVKFSM